MIDMTTFEEFIKVAGVTSQEDHIRDVIQNNIMEFIDELRINEFDNLYAINKKDGSSHIAIVANMDEPGLVVTNIDDAGFLRFRKLGCVDERTIAGAHVELNLSENKKVNGVVGWISPDLMVDKEKDLLLNQVVKYQDLFIDIGASSREEVLEMGIYIGSTIAFTKNILELANNKIASKGLDNRVGCYILFEVIRQINQGLNFKGTITSIFTTQHEFGSKGAQAVTFGSTPDIAIVLDTIPAPDFPGVHHLYKDHFKIGAGPVIRMLDYETVTNEKPAKKIEIIASKNDIPTQRGVAGGCSNVLDLQRFNSGVEVIPLCVPCRYTHTTGEMISLDDVENTIKLLIEIIKEYL